MISNYFYKLQNLKGDNAGSVVIKLIIYMTLKDFISSGN
jgi:hypothetical protein